MKRASLLLLPLLLLGGCATTGGGGDVPANADVTSKTMGNGDKVDEYRVNGQLEMVRVTPARGAPYFLYDRDMTAIPTPSVTRSTRRIGSCIAGDWGAVIGNSGLGIR